MKTVFNLTNKYIILLTPLLLYSLFSSIYLAVSVNGVNIMMAFFALAIFFFMTAAFVAGWFNMVKLSVIDKAEEPNSIIKEFISGVGEYILPSIGLLINIFILSVLALFLSYKVGLLLIGEVSFSMEAFTKAMENISTFKIFVSGLSQEELIKISNWNALILSVLSLTYFLLIFYLPALFFESKNPFKALYLSLKRLFSKTFLKTCAIYLLIFIINFLLSLFSVIFTGNTIMHFIITLLNFYFVVVVSIGIFYFYYKSFITKNLGLNIDIKI